MTQDTWNPVKQKSLQRNRAILLQGLLFCAQNTVLEAFFGILAQKTAISFARIREVRSKTNGRTLSVLPFVLDAEVFAVAVVEVGGLGVFGVR